ncbi:ejaculatory bulb-specific protein 3-like [Anthonomus grandis grandis]|uniref:ejaculatory bulb-specific protein 3-like n=1 Tax=Anthonomus grandis grandis TaxID=2921223 RepID=UPI00216586B5|nr:ejaculatory bulb-specific protein 3-like [Anthonomus grandis grandis]
MKLFLVIFMVQIVLSVGQKYTSRYDNLNIDQVLSNKRVLGNYIKCILDEGPCTAEGRELRKHIPEAIESNCAKCTEAQKRFVKKGANFVKANHPKDWSRIARKYDPEGTRAASFNNFLSS